MPSNRQNLRIPISGAIQLKIAHPPQNVSNLITGQSVNLSLGGVGVNLDHLILPRGTEGELEFAINGTHLKTKCKIAQSEAKNTTSKVRLIFDEMTESQKNELKKILDSYAIPKRKFAFITNLRDAGDWPRVVYTSKYWDRTKDPSYLKENPGYVLWTRFNVYEKVEGHIVVVLLTGKEILALPPKKVRQQVLNAVLFAQNELGVEYIGLGSYMPSVTRQGEWLANHREVKAYLTHGDHLTTWIGLEGIGRLNMNLREKKIAIIGASGLIGQGLSRILALQAGELTLIGRNPHKLAHLKEIIIKETRGIAEHIQTTSDIKAIKNADIVISVTSSPDALIKEDYLKKGVVIYDLAQPMDVPMELCAQRGDIAKIDGGFVEVPEVNVGVDLGTPKGSVFACLADVMLQALENAERSFVGPIDPRWVTQMGILARKYGFKHAALSSFSWPLPEICLGGSRKQPIST